MIAGLWSRQEGPPVSNRLSMRTAVAAAVVVLGGLLAAVPSEASAADSAEVTVTWPTVSAFNPDVYDYAFNVAYDGPGTLQARDTTDWSDMGVVLGDNRPELADGVHQIQVLLCTDVCQVVSQSPQFWSYRSVPVYGGRSTLGPVSRPYAWLGGDSTRMQAPFDIDWQVRTSDPAAPPLASGSASGVTSFPSVGSTSALVDQQTYVYAAHVTLSGEEWGGIETTVEHEFTWDSIPPTSPVKAGYQVGPSGSPELVESDEFFPPYDQYEDRYVASVRTTDGQPRSFKVYDKSGSLVTTLRPRSASGRTWAVWDGRKDGGILDEGLYHLIVILEDSASNVTTFEKDVRLHQKRIVTRTFRHTYPAARTVTNEFVGKCGRLARPARANWPGSLGYLSSPCRRADDMLVQTSNAARIPYSNVGDYLWSRVTVTGGPSTRAWSYMVLWYFDAKKHDWDARVQLSSRYGDHRGQQVSATHSVLAADSHRPYVAWNIGLNEGAQYDVKSFTVEVAYRTLR